MAAMMGQAPQAADENRERDKDMVLVVVYKQFFIFTPIWGNDPILLIFFRWVETTK